MAVTGAAGAARGGPAQELRPTGRGYARAVLPALPVAALLIGVRVWVQSRSLVVALAVVAGTVVVVGGFVVLFVRDVRWLADARAIHRRGIFGGSRLVDRSHIASVLLATHFSAGRRPLPAVLLVLRDRSGRSLLRLSGPIWDTAQVEAFVRDAGLGPVTRIDEPTDTAYMRRNQPGALGWAAEHPGAVIALTVVVTLVVIAAVVGGVALTVGIGS